jgi:two-component system, NarL family, sensor kinase
LQVQRKPAAVRIYSVYQLLFSGALLFAATGHAQENFSAYNFQEEKSKAITQLNQKTKPDTARINALIVVLNKAYFTRQRRELLPYCEEAMDLSRKLNYSAGLSRGYIFKGNLYSSDSVKDRAHAYFDSAIAMGRLPADSVVLQMAAEAHRGKAHIYQLQENNYRALNHFFECLKYYESRHHIKAQHIYASISEVYSALRNYDQAAVYAGKGMELADKDTSIIMKMQAYTNLSSIYIQLGDLAQARIYLDKLKPYMPHPQEVMVNNLYYSNLGEVYFRQGRYDSAFHYYYQSYLMSAENSMHNFNRPKELYHLATCAQRMGKYELAGRYARESLEDATQKKSKSGIVKALFALSEYYSFKGNTGKAYDMLKRATILQDSVLMEANLNQVNTLATVYESDKKEKEIMQLQNEKEIQAAVVKRKSVLNQFFIASIIALLVLGYLAYANFRKNQLLAKQQQELQRRKIAELEKDKQLSSINAMLRGQEEERSRMAKDLHDGLGSALSGNKLALMNVKKNLTLTPEETVLFDRALSMLDNTIGDLRKIAHNLMPEALVKFGLQEAIRDYCDFIEKTSGLQITYQQFGVKRKPDSTAEVFVYRIIQELVTNVVRHAGASRIMIQLHIEPQKIGITVEDDGKGYDLSANGKNRGSGMANISYRVKYFNGTTDIVTAPGSGTSVNIELMA